MGARREALQAALEPLQADLARVEEELAEARVIRGHVSSHPDRFSTEERETVLERAEELAARRVELACAIEHTSQVAGLLEEVLAAAAETVLRERLQIARDLHDGPVQALANLVLEAEVLERLLERDPQRLAGELQQFQTTVRDAVAEIRGFLVDLRPPSIVEVGLVGALRRMTENWERQAGTACQLKIAGEERRLPPMVEEALFWIVTEALTNVQKHARARRVAIELDIRGATAGIRIRDDGSGFDVTAPAPPGSPPQLGLLGMRERVLAAGGVLEVRSRPGSGTFVEAELPVAE